MTLRCCVSLLLLAIIAVALSAVLNHTQNQAKPKLRNFRNKRLRISA